jgi:phospholipid/cholesterol/gamma-HCH transport system permease protein
MIMLRLLEKIGDKTLALVKSFYNAVFFVAECFIHMINPKSYNPAMITVLIKQIYFTAVGILPLFITMSVLFGSIIIGVVVSLASQYNLQDQIGSIIINFAVDEFSPFFTALLITLRSSTAVNAEIAVMKVNKELNTLKQYKINLIDYLFIPRIISGVISVSALSVLFAVIMTISGYIFSFFYMGMDLYSYKNLLIDAIEFNNMAILLIKSAAFGFVAMVIPIYSGLNAFESYTAIPISVLQGMVRLFISLFFIEVLSLLVQFI